MNGPEIGITNLPDEKEQTSNSKEFGVYEETDPLRRVLVWGPPGVEAYLSQLYPDDISLFLDEMDVITSRQESHDFVRTLEEHDVKVLRVRDTLAQQLNPIEITAEELLSHLIEKAGSIHAQYPEEADVDPDIITQLFERDINRYGSDAAIALNSKLSLDPDMPVGNTIYACDQMKMVLDRRVQAKFLHEIRKPEVKLYEGVYTALGSTNPITIPEGETFEGGDLYIHNKVVYIGIGVRTSQGAALHIFEELGESIEKAGYEFAMVVDRNHSGRPKEEKMDYMHLDTWSEPLDEHTVMLFPDEAGRRDVCMVERGTDGTPQVVSTQKNYIEFLRDRGDVILEVPSDEQKNFALNNLSLNSDVIFVSNDTNREMLDRLAQAKKTTIPLSLTQTTKGYGAAHCMTAQLSRLSDNV